MSPRTMACARTAIGSTRLIRDSPIPHLPPLRAAVRTSALFARPFPFCRDGP
jgi:hypothetical protein